MDPRAAHPSNRVTLANAADVVRYHKPTGDQVSRHERVALLTEALIIGILENAPDCADRTAAIRYARSAKMNASAAIALEPAEGVAP